MKAIWTPWRMPYILSIKKGTSCVFCSDVFSEERNDGDGPSLLLHRGRTAFVVLNLYPYTIGHLMVVPYRHVARLQDLEPREMEEISLLLRDAERTVARVLGDRIHHVGINTGHCAGAGVEGHLHLHLVPDPNEKAAEARDRDPGDPPEPPARTRERLLAGWRTDSP
ncbi:MAG: HIT domain-containing protein [Candidatus Eisenbacteria bacterium]|nr:HIT domain-containing protein [Candidatus Latescibacterota bacterium]MBD3301336.1 HIT domain-containing protein [Candidatus Eisenbacteria bacterium]